MSAAQLAQIARVAGGRPRDGLHELEAGKLTRDGGLDPLTGQIAVWNRSHQDRGKLRHGRDSLLDGGVEDRVSRARGIALDHVRGHADDLQARGAGTALRMASSR